MMKITDCTRKTIIDTTLNEIPVGQVFRGSVAMAAGGYHTGIFFKAQGPHMVGTTSDNHSATRRDVAVVCLSGKPQDFANIWLWCRAVRDYEPLDTELVIK